MKNNLLGSAVGAVVLTAVTRFINATPGGGFVGASWFGWPMTWIRYIVVGPQYNPWVVDWYGLAGDLVFWFVVSFALLYLYGNMKGGSKKKGK